MNQLRVRYHQLKIDMFALYQATMDSRGVKVHRVEQALGDMPTPGPSDVKLKNEDAAYVQTLSEMEKKITVGEHGRRRRHMLRKLDFRDSSDPEVAETLPCAEGSAPGTPGCRELDRHSNITVLRCYRCTKRFDDQTSLFAHWRDEINCHIVCLFCREEFITNAKHDQHIRLCQALCCAQCKVQCQDYAGYEQHIPICQFAGKCEPVEVLAARVQCPYCHRLFTQIHMFKRHLKVMHEMEHMQRFGLKIQRKFRPNEREFPCRQCGRTFNRVYNLKMHQLSHGRHGQYRCDACNKTFRFRSNLERHVRSHSVQQQECRACGQQFRLLRQLRQHMNLVHDKDTFLCEICQKSCDGYQRLVAHGRTHQAQKSYACGDCGRTFTVRHKYKEHMNVHEGRFAYECHLCSERFFMRDHLRRHYRKTHPEVKRLPRRATTRRPVNPDRQFYEPADLGPMINDTVTLYQASAAGGDPSVVKFEVVGEPCDGAPVEQYAAATTDQTSQEMLDGGYQVYEGSEQQLLGEYTTVVDGVGYPTAGPCHRPGQIVQYYQQQVADGVDGGAATLLSLDPAPASSVPEGATVTTYIIPETGGAQFSVQDADWTAAGLLNFQSLATPEKTSGLAAPLYSVPQAAGGGAHALFLTPDKSAPPHLFMTPESGGGGGGAAGAQAAFAAHGLSAEPAPLLATPERRVEPGYPASSQPGSPLVWSEGARLVAAAADQEMPYQMVAAGGGAAQTALKAAGVMRGEEMPLTSGIVFSSPPRVTAGEGGAISTSPQQSPIFVSAPTEPRQTQYVARDGAGPSGVTSH